ncbi:MAG: SCO family protein [Polynucleobacter sp.]|jgi:protein SCO1/2|nr:SCO family protein [Polynucleobacter sp.]
MIDRASLFVFSLALSTLISFGDTFAETSRSPEAAVLMNQLMSGKAPVGGPFTLTDQYGQKRSLSDFKGKIVLIYFGYISCPDVCPGDLMAITQLMKRLKENASKVQPLFITLDPKRDTAEVLRQYLKNFYPGILGLYGSEAETLKIAKAYKTYYEKIGRTDANNYFIDHTAFIYLINQSGKYLAFFPPGTPPERMEVMVMEELSKLKG